MAFYKKKNKKEKRKSIIGKILWGIALGAGLALIGAGISSAVFLTYLGIAAFTIPTAAVAKGVFKNTRKKKFAKKRQQVFENKLIEKGIDKEKFIELGGIPPTEVSLDNIDLKSSNVYDESYKPVRKDIRNKGGLKRWFG